MSQFSMDMFGVGVSPVDGNAPPPPQLVMLASVALTSSEAGAEEKEMVELQPVGNNSYSDSEEEGVIRYSYDNQNNIEVCIVEYADSPAPTLTVVEDQDGGGAEDLTQRALPSPPSTPPSPPPAATKDPQQSGEKRKEAPGPASEGPRKKKPFHCKPCNFQAQSEEQFVEHLSSHSVSKMIVVNRVEGRSKTRTKEPPQSSETEADPSSASGDLKGLIRCERCGYNTNRYDHYIAHLKHHNKEGDDDRVFKCTLCPYTTVSQYHWRKHLRNHFPSKLHTCSQCSYFSDRKSNYIQHIRTHTGVRPFQCLYCDYSSSQKTHLTRHMRTHSGERPFKCDSCPYLAANQHEVTRHARQVHNGPKPLSCPYCEYKTADRSNFKKHVELHIHPRQFLCPLCKYAASKKCNLQYHIKSRHSGCNVSVDVSKVKLKKKPNTENTHNSKKADASSSVEEDFDVDEVEEDSRPINLSVRKSSRPSVVQQATNETPQKPLKKSTVTSDKQSKAKEKVEPEKKINTRQKKVEKVPESPGETQTEAETPGNKPKRRVKKPSAEKTAQDQKEDSQKEQTEMDNQTRPEEVKSAKQNVDKIEQKGNQNSNKNVSKLRKSESKKAERTTENQEDPPQKPIPAEKSAKERGVKRKAGDVLDLSKKPKSSTKTRNLKAKAAPEEKVTSTSPVAVKPRAGNQKKSRSKKEPRLQQTKESAKDQESPAICPPLEVSGVPNVVDDSTEIMSNRIEKVSEQTETMSEQTETRPELTETTSDLLKITNDSTETLPSQTEASSKESSPSDCQKPEIKVSQEAEEVELPPTPSPSEERPAPTFLKPTSPPRLVLRTKPAEPEDDEGIHSSHEGCSDISDSASVSSDDSGLHGPDGSSGKMANDPETPTEELPTPTELKSHTCIFCDRTFPLEAEYRRHLNRHLVNVYYMDSSKNQP